MGMILDRIEKTGNMSDMKEVAGLRNVAAHVIQHLNILAQDKSQAERVKKYGDTLAKFGNLIKGLEQRLAEQGAGTMDETQAKIQEKMMLAQVNAEIKQGKAAQQMKQKDEQFLANQARENAALQNKLQQDLAVTEIEANKIDVIAAAEIRKKLNEPPKPQK
jgi:hypothetical protein